MPKCFCGVSDKISAVLPAAGGNEAERREDEEIDGE